MSASVLFDAPGPKARVRYRLVGVVGLLGVAAVLGAIVWKLQSKGQFDAAKWKPFLEGELWDAYLLPGLTGTLKAAAISIVLAAIVGTLLALARMSSLGPLRWFAGSFVELFRAIPVLLMMIFVWGLISYARNPDVALYSVLGGVDPNSAPLIAVVTGLTLYNGSVICEVIRSGVDQLPKGQREAGLSIGLSQQQTLRTILLPQAVTAMLPSLVSQLVVVLKDTALGYNVTYAELLYTANQASSNYANLVPLVMVVALIYIAMNYALTKVAEWVEGRLKRRGRTGVAAAGQTMAINTATGG